MRTDCLQCSSLLVAVCLICLFVCLVCCYSCCSSSSLSFGLFHYSRYLVVQARCLNTDTYSENQKDGPSHASCVPLLLTCEALGTLDTGHDFTHIPTMHMTRNKRIQTSNISIISFQYSILIKKKHVYYTLKNTSLRMIYLQTPQFTPQIPKIHPPPSPCKHHQTPNQISLWLAPKGSNFQLFLLEHGLPLCL